MESVTKNHHDSNEIVQIDEKYKVFLEFENITCILYRFIFNKLGFEKKEVLKGVSGCFKPGEFTAILGPSGAGKTTLLNILSGYSTFGAKGTIKINGVSASASKSSNRGGAKYIRQEDDSRSHLTLYESMYFAAALKLAHLTSQERHRKIIEILKDLNISESQKTLYRNLSGGEKRRLAVSVELLSDPSLIFFDEPTTGLDSVASSSLVKLLSKLAKGGRTIIATIQQPSALLLEKIDRIYCLAEGRTFYDAPRENIIPALNYAGLYCPPHHNPADFLIEIASAESETTIEEAASGILRYNSSAAVKNNSALISTSEYETNKICKLKNEASYIWQIMILIYRSYVIAVRNYKFFVLRTFAYILTGFLIGKVYPMAGSDASTVVGNVSSIYSCSIFIIYAALMYVTLTSNLETEILKGEHFNKWYKLGPYMISFLSVELPFQVIMTSLCGYICYWLTGNPMEYERVLYYLVAMLLMSLCSLSWGFFLGSTVPIKIAVFIGPMVTTVYSLFAFSITLRDTPYPFRWVYHISYFRAGCHIAINAIYGNVKKLPCSKEYCHFMAPQQFLKEMDVIPIDVPANIALLVFSTVLMFALTYLSLYLRLNKR